MYKDKVVVITGGSQGIGQHLALAYLEQQAKVIVLDIAPIRIQIWIFTSLI